MPSTFIVVADLKNYSSLSDRATLGVFEEVLPAIGKLLETGSAKSELLDINTWGDAILAVFRGTTSGVEFALGLRDLFTTKAWKRDGLSDLRARIAVHVADVEEGKDHLRTLIGTTQVHGKAIALPARIEPVTPPGAIFATASAATAIRQVNAVFPCDVHPVGVVETAKDYGAHELWEITRPGESAKGLLPAMPHPGPIEALRYLSDLVEAIRDAAERESHKEVIGRYAEYLHRAIRVGMSRHPFGVEVDFGVYGNGQAMLWRGGQSKSGHLAWFPPHMPVPKSKTLPARSGVAAAVAWWFHQKKKPAIAIVKDLKEGESGDATFVEDDGAGWTEQKEQKDVFMWNRPPRLDPVRPYRSMLCAPIIAFAPADILAETRQGELLGFLCITSERPSAFQRGDLPFVAAAASHLAYAYRPLRSALVEIAASSPKSAQVPGTRNTPKPKNATRGARGGVKER